MKIQLVRHATLWLTYNGKKILVDPMLGEKGAYPPIVGSSNDRRNPLVPLPILTDDITRPDAIIITHLHNDHWDPEAMSVLPRNCQIFCQPGDENKIIDQGFTNVTAIEHGFNWHDISFKRTPGMHGTGDIAIKMGNVSGFILQAANEPSLYIAGDTIFYDEVEKIVKEDQPDVIVVNAGGARFAVGDAITMTPEDVVAVCRTLPESQVVAVHMDSINHCLDTRDILQDKLSALELVNQVNVPLDGEELLFHA